MLQAAMLALLLSLVETETGRTALALPMPMLQAAMMALSFSLSRHQENSKHPWQFLYGNASSSYDGSPSLSGGDRDWQNIMGIAHANASSSYDASLSPSPSKHQEAIQTIRGTVFIVQCFKQL